MTRRDWLLTVVGTLAAGPVTVLVRSAPNRNDVVEVWKSATCGCCSKWVDHMRVNGFEIRVSDVQDVSPFRRKHGVPTALSSCHTATVDGYTIEGHVPADIVRQLLKQQPRILGIAVPGMPMGSPGMEGPRKDKYDVIAFTKDGKTTVFASR